MVQMVECFNGTWKNVLVPGLSLHSVPFGKQYNQLSIIRSKIITILNQIENLLYLHQRSTVISLYPLCKYIRNLCHYYGGVVLKSIKLMHQGLIQPTLRKIILSFLNHNQNFIHIKKYFMDYEYLSKLAIY